MTLVDALVVTLGLDAAGFVKGAKDVNKAQKGLSEEARKAQKELEAQAKKAAEGIRKLRDEVLALTGAFLGARALKSIADKLTTIDTTTGKFARNMGLSAERVSAFELGIRKLGGSADDADGALRNLVKIQEEFKQKGTSGALTGALGQAFGRYGDSQGFSRFLKATGSGDTIGQMRELLSLRSRMSDKDAQFLFGETGFSEGFITSIRSGREAVEQAVASMGQYAVTIGQAEAAQRRASKETEVSAAAQMMWNRILEKATPIILRVLDGLQKLLDFANNHIPLTIVLMTALGAAMTAVTAVSFLGLIGGIGGVTAAMTGAATAAASLLPLLGAVAAGGFAGTQVARLWSAMADYHETATRKGVTLTPGAQARVNAGETAGVLNSASGSLFSRLEAANGLPPGLLDSIWAQESGRGKNMLSKAGAQGHFGLMPGTAAELGVTNPNDLGQSASGAARYLSRLLKMFHGNLGMALAGYNWGAGNVLRHGIGNAPLETLNYMRQVPARMSAASSATNIHIAKVDVHTAATDGKGTGRDFYSGVVAAAQSNRGLQ